MILHRNKYIITLRKIRLLWLLVIFSLFASVSIARASLRVTDVRDYGDDVYSVFYFRLPGGEDEVFMLGYRGGSFTTRATTEVSDKPIKVKSRNITCPVLPASVVVSGYGKDTQCKQVGAAGVAIPELMAQGILDAVDVFGIVDAELRVCFRQRGRLKFLDSTTMPRAQLDLAAEYTDGMTCGRIDRIGTVALLEGSEPAVEATDIAPATVVREEVASTVCRLVTTDNLSLRSGPNVFYARIDIIPRGTRLNARARSNDWFIVDYEGLRGWVIDDYVTASAGCDAVQEGNAVFLSPAEAVAPEAPAEAEAIATPAPQGPSVLNCGLRTGDIINLRLRPGIEQEILAEIPFKTELIATERAGDWFKVEYEGQLGWVNIDYVFRSGYCG